MYSIHSACIACIFNAEAIKHRDCVSFFNRKTIFDDQPADPNYQPMPEDRPGGFNWGAREEVDNYNR